MSDDPSTKNYSTWTAEDFDVAQRLAEAADPACLWAAAHHLQVHGRHQEDGQVIADFRDPCGVLLSKPFSFSYSLLGAVALPEAT